MICNPALFDFLRIERNNLWAQDYKSCAAGDIPLPMIVLNGIITSHLNKARTINNSTKEHQGLDIGAKRGTVVRAAASGVVLYAGKGEFKDNPITNPRTAPYAGDGGGWGNYIVIDHGNGYLTLYAHLTEGSISVAEGQPIEDGQPIGGVGNSGHSYGNHLHIEAIYNEDGSTKYKGSQFNRNLDPKSAHVFSLEDVNDLEDVINNREKVDVKMLNGTIKTLGSGEPTFDLDLEEVVISAKQNPMELKTKPPEPIEIDLEDKKVIQN